MERIKLQLPGESHTMVVKSVSAESVKDAKYYLFSDGATELLVPQSSVERQLNEQLGVSNVLETVGMNIRFARSEELSKFGQPYWNLAPATSDAVAQVPAAVPTSSVQPTKTPNPAPTPATGDEALERERYRAIANWYFAEIVPLYEQAKVGCSPESVTAGIATLFINGKKR